MTEKIRVYKTRKTKDNARSYAFVGGRPWKVGPTPEDSRETYWRSWDEAMDWATMDPFVRRAKIKQDYEWEGGW